MEIQMVLLRRYRVRKAGSRGYLISLPNEYVEDAKIRAGQKLAMYRDGNKLVLIPEAENKESSQEARK